MIEFEIKSRKLNIGKRKGQTVYYASPKPKLHLTNKMVVDRIVSETSLSAGDVSNSLISLGAVVREALKIGASIDLADLGSFHIIVPSKMVDKEADVCANTLKKPKIVFTPKVEMRNAAKAVELNVDNPKRRKKEEEDAAASGNQAHP